MPKSRDNLVAGIFIIALLLGGVFLLTRKQAGVSYYRPRLENGASNGVKHFPIVEDVSMESRPGRRYSNTEVWDIDWTEDGLPKRVTIHRDAVQS